MQHLSLTSSPILLRFLQLDDAETNYEKIFEFYERAKEYYRGLEAQVEAAAAAAHVDKQASEEKAQAAQQTITTLEAKLAEECKARSVAEAQLDAAKTQLQQLQSEMSAARQQLDDLATERDAAVKARAQADEAMREREAAVAAAQMDARSTETAAGRRLAAAERQESLVEAAQAELKNRQAALEEQEAALRKKEADHKKKEAEIATKLAALEERAAELERKEEASCCLHQPLCWSIKQCSFSPTCPNFCTWARKH